MMKPKPCFLAALLALMASLPAYAQEVALKEQGGESWLASWFTLRTPEHPWYFGVYGGGTRNTLYQGGAENYRPTQEWDSGEGWTAGLIARYQVFNWLGVQVEPAYITKNYATRWTGIHKFMGKNSTTNGFVEFPLLANLSIGAGDDNARLRLFVNAGFFMGAWVYSREKGVAPVLENAYPGYEQINADTWEYDTPYTFDEKRDNRFDGGFLAGFGVQFDLKAFGVFAECRYNYSFSDLQKQYQEHSFAPQKNDTWSVQAGLLINPGLFGGKK
jgi:hypothetical protein